MNEETEKKSLRREMCVKDTNLGIKMFKGVINDVLFDRSKMPNVFFFLHYIKLTLC